MNIEFYTPSKGVSDSLVAFIRDTILQLHKQHNELSKAEVSFKEKKKIVTTQKICEINLPLFKNSISVIAAADNYEKAGRKAIRQLYDAIAARFKTNHTVNTELPHEEVTV
jgi:hypothetical protein